MSFQSLLRHTLYAGCALLFIASAGVSAAQDNTVSALPPPQLNRGKPLMQVFKERKTTREFASRDLSGADLSNLLWAGFGINRPKTGGHTAPSALNMQETSLYVCMARGVFVYDAKANVLKRISTKDIRKITGTQDYVGTAPVNVVLVADYARMGKVPQRTQQTILATADAAYISANMYLYCASEGLATVVRASIDKPVLAKELGLTSTQDIMLAQSVGYSKK